MSSTRYAPLGAPFSCERYMSNSRFAELRGIPGAAVAAKAELYSDLRQRSLIFFLQALSLKPGGLERVGHWILEHDGTAPRLPANRDIARELLELCVNPDVAIQLSPERDRTPSRWTIVRLVQEFQRIYETKARRDFVLTTIGQQNL
jgi:hypothetical protein